MSDVERKATAAIERGEELLHQFRNAPAALEAFLQALHLAETSWGPTDVRLVQLLRLIAECSSVRAECATSSDALPYLSRALSIAMLHLPSDDEQVLSLQAQVGMELCAANQIREGRALLERCVAVATARGEFQGDLRMIISALASVILDMEHEPDAALWYCEESARLHAQRSPGSISHADSLFRLGRCLHELGRSSDAAEKLSEAMSMLEALPDTRARAMYLREIGDLLSTLGSRNAQEC